MRSRSKKSKRDLKVQNLKVRVNTKQFLAIVRMISNLASKVSTYRTSPTVLLTAIKAEGKGRRSKGQSGLDVVYADEQVYIRSFIPAKVLRVGEMAIEVTYLTRSVRNRRGDEDTVLEVSNGELAVSSAEFSANLNVLVESDTIKAGIPKKLSTPDVEFPAATLAYGMSYASMNSSEGEDLPAIRIELEKGKQYVEFSSHDSFRMSYVKAPLTGEEGETVKKDQTYILDRNAVFAFIDHVDADDVVGLAVGETSYTVYTGSFVAHFPKQTYLSLDPNEYDPVAYYRQAVRMSKKAKREATCLLLESASTLIRPIREVISVGSGQARVGIQIRRDGNLDISFRSEVTQAQVPLEEGVEIEGKKFKRLAVNAAYLNELLELAGGNDHEVRLEWWGDSRIFVANPDKSRAYSMSAFEVA